MILSNYQKSEPPRIRSFALSTWGEIMKQILEYFKKTEYFKKLLEDYHTHDEIKITNTNDPVSVLMIYFLYKEINQDIVLVAPNLFKAQKLYDAMSEISQEDELSFFPQDEFITTEMLAMSTEFKLERINTVRKIIEKKRSIIITNTSGYIKQLIPLKKWENAIVSWKEEDVIDVKELPNTLSSFGYKRESTVEKPGEFSIRGSIVDVYPLNESTPYRIDLFDDEIDTIRTFDVSTQRSNIRTKKCEIYPMYEFFYNDEELQGIKNKVEDILDKSSFDESSRERINQDLINLYNRNEIDQLSRYLTLQYDTPECLMDYIAGTTTIFFDYNRIMDNYNDIIRDIRDWYEGTNDYPKLGFSLIKDINHVFSRKSLYLDVFSNPNLHIKKEISVRAKETTLYNNNLHMAINDLKKYNNYTTVIIAFTTLKKAKNFTALLDDKVPFRLIGSHDLIKEKRINIIVEEKYVSVELFNTNTIILTEENLYKKTEMKKAKYQSMTKDTKKINTIEELKKGDHIVHYNYGIGRFIEVKTMSVGEITNDYIHIAYKGDDSLYIPIENIKLLGNVCLAI